MKKSSSLPETTMKSARFDVFKFGMRGMDKASREDAEVARLVSLGARKPKNKGYGYKEFKVMNGMSMIVITISHLSLFGAVDLWSSVALLILL